MQDVPKGLRKHIAIMGRRNVGKSALVNALANQGVSIVSANAGTTTDPVEKTMELAPLGAVVLTDTAGIDDEGELGALRVARSNAIMDRADMAVIVTDGQEWGEWERQLWLRIKREGLPFVIARNKNDAAPAGLPAAPRWLERIGVEPGVPVVDVSALAKTGVEELIGTLGRLNAATESYDRPLVQDLLPQNGLVLLITPIDSGAPKGRLSLPPSQAIRDSLDGNKLCMIMTASEYASGLGKLASAPDLVVADSQVVKEVARQTPAGIPLTTFSILMARFKGRLEEFARGTAALTALKPGDRVMIQEACSHHPQPDDIGREKIPRMLEKLAGGKLDIVFSAGKEMASYPAELKAIVHCGACVVTRQQMLARQRRAAAAAIPMANYGMTISLAQGVLVRTLAPFPAAMSAFQSALGAVSGI